MWRLCAVVPVYNHEHAIAAVVRGITAAGIGCILVDDGSSPTCRQELQRLRDSHPDISLVRRDENGGKGAAVSDGLRFARAIGFTHALQIDADGQHDVNDIARFAAASQSHPESLICGRPVFDHTLPAARRFWRQWTHVLVRINTLSQQIRDSMCGFRIYPLGPVLALLDAVRLGARMDFDIELLVRLQWRAVPMLWLDTHVSYPADGISHFRLLRDNALITWLHVRMFFGMLIRSPVLLYRALLPAPSRREAAGR
jgi:glycosyltransferase involved in cell wall biosynthesis